ncbi:hypothetical protein [Actinacidiphila sp. bgisy167]|uniref:hypothetical protein n=1 Tax=Actinacidiphila sp. bgisy167 TaxID=3413797 RepID=UPI003D74AD51
MLAGGGLVVPGHELHPTVGPPVRRLTPLVQRAMFPVVLDRLGAMLDPLRGPPQGLAVVGDVGLSQGP